VKIKKNMMAFTNRLITWPRLFMLKPLSGKATLRR